MSGIPAQPTGAGPIVGQPGEHPTMDLPAYLLAALSSADEAAVTEHLADCDDCGRRVQDLAPVVAALARVDRDAVRAIESGGREHSAHEQATVPGRQAPGPVPPVRSRSDRSSARWLASAVGLAAAAAMIAVPMALSDGAEHPVSAQSTTAVLPPLDSTPPLMQPPQPADSRTFPYTGADTVTVTFARTSYGSSVNVRCTSVDGYQSTELDDQQTYALWIVRTSGEEVLVRSWPTVRGDATFPGRVDFGPQDFAFFQLRDGTGQVLAVAKA